MSTGGTHMLRASSVSSIKIHKSIKVVIVGDGAVGKTALLIYYTSKSFPHEYIPTVFDNYSCIEMFEQKPVSIVLWDTAGQEDYDKLRPLSYPQTDVFLVCFSVTRKDSFHNVKEKWIKEISPIGAPFILVATKQDIRNDKKTVAELGGIDKFVSTAEGQALAQEVGAGAYIECSAMSGAGIYEIFQETIRLSFAKLSRRSKKLAEITCKSPIDKAKEKEKEKAKSKSKEKDKEKTTSGMEEKLGRLRAGTLDDRSLRHSFATLSASNLNISTPGPTTKQSSTFSSVRGWNIFFRKKKVVTSHSVSAPMPQ